MDALIHNFFNFAILQDVYPLLIDGLRMTLYLTLVVVPAGALVGLLIAIAHSFRLWWINWLLILYVDFFRAFPPLVLLIFIFYGLPFLGVELNPFFSVTLAFTFNTSSYYGEIFRAGIESIGRGQMEAARSTGLTRLQAMSYITLPQAVRNVAPDLIGNTLEVVKLTSLASVVSLPELLRTARIAQDLTYNPTPLVVVALIYLAMLWPVVRLLSRMERRMLAGR